VANFTVRFNTAAISEAITKATNATVMVLDIELRKAITDPIWDWPRGESPRDIVDTGRLRNSQIMVRLGNRRAMYTWRVPYASIVRNGAVLRNGTVIPARKWDELAINRAELPEVFAQSFKINYR
jgi:hypothetical protein